MPISGISGLSSVYDIYSVYGNPSSMNKISAINDDTRSNPALVIAKEQEENKVQSVSDSEPATATAVGGFADILQMQEQIQSSQTQTVADSGQTNLQNVMDYMMSQSSFNISNIAMA